MLLPSGRASGALISPSLPPDREARALLTKAWPSRVRSMPTRRQMRRRCDRQRSDRCRGHRARRGRAAAAQRAETRTLGRARLLLLLLLLLLLRAAARTSAAAAQRSASRRAAAPRGRVEEVDVRPGSFAIRGV